MASSTIQRNPRRADDRPRSTLQYGDRLGRYLITGFAGKGATSYVYRARRQDSFDPVAIKVLHPHLLEDPNKRRRFFNEARLMLRMDHRNVVDFHEILETDEHVGFVMEYLDGVTLDRFLNERAGTIDEEILATLFIDILRGVAHAHEMGVLHRDLKPTNIMITEHRRRFRARILDFGVGRFADQAPHPEEREKIIGTAAYISPEEVEDPETVCHSSDLYSLGVMLYEAACGHRPFEVTDGDSRRLLAAHAHRQPPRPRRHNPDLDPAFEAIILKALRKRPEGRYDSAREMIDAMEEALRSMFEARASMPSIEEMAETTEWARQHDERDAGDDRAVSTALLAYLQMMLAALASTAAPDRERNAHHLDRDRPLHPDY